MTEIEESSPSQHVPFPNVSSSSSGIWEKSENKRWIVVTDSKHRIPSRSRTRSESSLDPSLSIHRYVSNFEVESPYPNNCNIISDGDSLVRFDGSLNESGLEVSEEQEDPGEGTSQMHTPPRRIAARSRRRSANLSSPEALTSQSQTDTEIKGRRRRRRRRRKKHYFHKLSFGKKPNFAEQIPNSLSVESSPGRDSPSPDALRMILERGLLQNN